MVSASFRVSLLLFIGQRNKRQVLMANYIKDAEVSFFFPKKLQYNPNLASFPSRILTQEILQNTKQSKYKLQLSNTVFTLFIAKKDVGTDSEDELVYSLGQYGAHNTQKMTETYP